METPRTLRDFLKTCVRHKEVFNSKHCSSIEEFKNLSHYKKCQITGIFANKELVSNDTYSLDYYRIEYHCERRGTSFFISTNILQHIQITNRSIKIKTGKLSIGKLKDLLRFFESDIKIYSGEGIEWFDHISYSSSVIKDLLTNRVYNLKTFITRYVKNMYHVECDDYKRINRIINDHLCGFSLMRCSLHDLKLFSTNFQSALYAIDPKTKLSFEHKQLLADVFKLAIKLNEKVNFNWSLKRLEAEHERQIRTCTELDFTEKSDEQIYKNVNLDTSTITLLNTEKSIFFEGKSMFHCLYSCYYERIKCHQYIAFHMTFPESCTFSVKLNHNNEVIMDQIYAKYDKHVSTETEFIAQQFIDANYDILRRMLTKEQVYL